MVVKTREPSPGLLEEFQKTHSLISKQAKRRNDSTESIEHLESELEKIHSKRELNKRKSILDIQDESFLKCAEFKTFTPRTQNRIRK